MPHSINYAMPPLMPKAVKLQQLHKTHLICTQPEMTQGQKLMYPANAELQTCPVGKKANVWFLWL